MIAGLKGVYDCGTPKVGQYRQVPCGQGMGFITTANGVTPLIVLVGLVGISIISNES